MIAFQDGIALLKMKRTDGKAVYFIMNCRTRTDCPDDERQGSDRYFFESYSCPTNWLRDCIEVYSEGEQDYHGIMEFVRSIKSEDVIKFDDEDNEDWEKTFPEVLSE